MTEREIRFAERLAQLDSESAFEVMARAKQLEAEGQEIVHLEIGQPNFPTPVHICETAYKAIRAGYTGYTPAAGLPEARAAIAEQVSKSRQVKVNPEQVVITPGAKPVIFFTALALLEAGDEAIYPDPGFPTYASAIRFAGAQPVPLPLLEAEEFRFRLDDLAAAISDRTKLLILNSPHNPTGGCLTLDDLQAIAALAQRHDFYILADEIYSRLIYEGEHHSILSLPGMAARTILLDGFSKTYAMTGWRLGYGVAPLAIAQKFEQLAINSYSCPCAFTQMAGIAALQGPQESVQAMAAEFQERRDILVAGLNAIPGITCRTPAGAFYAFPNVQKLPLNCRDLATYLLETAGVALLSGTAFGRYGSGYLRLAYTTSVENIHKALQRMQAELAQL